MKRYPDSSKLIRNNMQSNHAVTVIMNKDHVLFWFDKLKDAFDAYDLIIHIDYGIVMNVMVIDVYRYK